MPNPRPRTRLRTPGDAAERAAVFYRNNVQSWLDPQGFTPLVFALGNPTKDLAENDPTHVRTWIDAWRSYTGPGTVEWGTKRLGTFGTTTIPLRVLFDAPTAVARAAGAAREYARILRTHQTLHNELAAVVGEHCGDALARTFGYWRAWDDATTRRCIAVVQWLATHSSENYYVRELPIFGVDSKWVESHRAVLSALSPGITFKQPHQLIELRGLDGTPPHQALPMDGMMDLTHEAHSILIVENRTTFLALPQLPHVLALWGAGYRAVKLARIPWLHHTPVLYWGDLDSRGFEILNQLRSKLPHVQSVLMDTSTADHYADLAVDDPQVRHTDMRYLTPEESATYTHLATRGLRIEQERILLDDAATQLRQRL